MLRDHSIVAAGPIALHAALPQRIAVPTGSGGVWQRRLRRAGGMWERRVRRELFDLATTH